MKLRRVSWFAGMIVASSAIHASTLLAQEPIARIDSRPKFETRAELEAQAREAERQDRQSEAWMLRFRLEKGDFQEGDRIVVALHMNAAAPPETLLVREGRILQVPPLADMKLEGVLRSELTDRMREHFAKYLVDPDVRATPLLRVGVLGSVRNPGYYFPSADLLLSDIVMRAGGPSGEADLNRMIIRRGADVIWNTSDTRTALTDGLSLDRLHLRAGDELVIGQRRKLPWGTIISTGLGLATLLFALTR